jgi:hypothetical protein
MKSKISFSTLLNWLKTTEMFARPSRKLPGKWKLQEYYFEPGEELVNIKENQVKAENLFWEIEFTAEEQYIHRTNLPVPLIAGLTSGYWSRSRNFITLIHPKDFRNNVEFQFAIEKETLKLLKKDRFGKIEFFGFFRKTEN